MTGPTCAEGGCSCGAIRYRATGAGSAPALCHCRSCQRAAGAPVVAWVTFPEDAVEILCGEPACWHSSPGVTREFCARCGTPLSYRHDDQAGWVDLAVCNFDKPEQFPPTDNIWTEHRLGWMENSHHLPSFARTRGG
ncbi:MAG: GFA family protein [Gammaproteobacteria bacterium]